MSFVNITRMYYVHIFYFHFRISSFWCKTTLFHVSSITENTVPCPIFCQPSTFIEQNSINIVENMQIKSKDMIVDIIIYQCDFFRNFYDFFSWSCRRSNFQNRFSRNHQNWMWNSMVLRARYVINLISSEKFLIICNENLFEMVNYMKIKENGKKILSF